MVGELGRIDADRIPKAFEAVNTDGLGSGAFETVPGRLTIQGLHRPFRNTRDLTVIGQYIVLTASRQIPHTTDALRRRYGYHPSAWKIHTAYVD